MFRTWTVRHTAALILAYVAVEGLWITMSSSV